MSNVVAPEPSPEPCDIPHCPVCAGRMELVYNRYHQKVCVCTDCHVGITIPSSAWEVVRLKRERKWRISETE